MRDDKYIVPIVSSFDAAPLYQDLVAAITTLFTVYTQVQNFKLSSHFVTRIKMLSVLIVQTKDMYHGVYRCLIFEMSIWEFITSSKKNRF